MEKSFRISFRPIMLERAYCKRGPSAYKRTCDIIYCAFDKKLGISKSSILVTKVCILMQFILNVFWDMLLYIKINNYVTLNA